MNLCSSYRENNYGQLIQSLVALYNPEMVVEFGILGGYSLNCILDAVEPETIVRAYDIFDDYQYRHADYKYLYDRYGEIIQYGDFYQHYKDMPNNSVDLFHIDVSNDGRTYQVFFDHYMDKLTDNGIALLEGGTEERDKGWIKSYGHPPIVPVLIECPYEHFVFNPFPGLTVVKKQLREAK